jgi:hypothetical protein
VSLHVLKTNSLSRRNCGQCSNLIHDEIFDLTRCRSNVPSAEANEIGESRVSAYRHSMLSSQGNGLAHHTRVARMKTTRNARRRNGGHEKRVLAELVSSEGLPHIRIEIQTHYCEDTRVILPTYLATVKTRTRRFS